MVTGKKVRILPSPGGQQRPDWGIDDSDILGLETMGNSSHDMSSYLL